MSGEVIPFPRTLPAHVGERLDDDIALAVRRLTLVRLTLNAVVLLKEVSEHLPADYRDNGSRLLRVFADGGSAA